MVIGVPKRTSSQLFCTFFLSIHFEPQESDINTETNLIFPSNNEVKSLSSATGKCVYPSAVGTERRGESCKIDSIAAAHSIDDTQSNISCLE